ncbi:MAG TPA: acyltransferase [Vitreimonas sp.]|uniref:acyltransferase n=1 Tax=Vitreimonas sp. TaxID=3069702 RepID=UPI002D3017AA|nr:acyltransferase [Vitreimonas sp.]HYD87301.1 acyltransferase [Vitreimonas sp.]
MTDRRYDLDWLRIVAFGLLILYHVGMFYVTWDWHVKSSRASEAIEPLMLLSNPWRLTLLFLISGAATRFMADKLSAWKLTSSRMGRLWPPLLLAVFVIVPPQSYYEIVEALQAMPPAEAARYPLTLDNFYLKYVTASGAWCDADGCLTTPTYNHMWFVAYLILYTLALVPLLPLLRRIPKAVGLLIAGPLLIVTPWLIMAALRVTLFPIFGESHDFREDWYLHALYFGVFLFGFAIAKHEPFFEACVRWRWAALAIALTCWAALIVYFNAHPDGVAPAEWLRMLMRAVRELDAWCAIVAAIGFAHRHLKEADGPVRRLLTQAIFPFYLIHQTIIVAAGHHLDALALPLWIEAPLLIGTTALGCWIFFDLGRRVPALRVWIGLPSKAGPTHGRFKDTTTGEARQPSGG